LDFDETVSVLIEHNRHGAIISNLHKNVPAGALEIGDDNVEKQIVLTDSDNDQHD